MDDDELFDIDDVLEEAPAVPVTGRRWAQLALGITADFFTLVGEGFRTAGYLLGVHQQYLDEREAFREEAALELEALISAVEKEGVNG